MARLGFGKGSVKRASGLASRRLERASRAPIAPSRERVNLSGAQVSYMDAGGSSIHRAALDRHYTPPRVAGRESAPRPVLAGSRARAGGSGRERRREG